MSAGSPEQTFEAGPAKVPTVMREERAMVTVGTEFPRDEGVLSVVCSPFFVLRFLNITVDQFNWGGSRLH